nr:CocE/NonD family hydrolase [Candidatus Sigynarchaeota archaeon]
MNHITVLKVVAGITLVAIAFAANGLIFTFSINQNRVTMRDGYKLYTRIYFPPNWTMENGSRPVILERTAYNCARADFVALGQSFANQGYIGVVQDVRGAWGSRGSVPFQVYHTEGPDGVDTVNWILAQPWCNGNIATSGSSGDAATELYGHAAGENVKAAFINVGAADLYDQWIFTGGCFQKWFMDVWLPGVDGLGYYQTLFDHAAKDDWWAATSVTMNDNARNVHPRAVHFGGWYDCFQQGTIDSFMWYNKNGTDYAKGHQILVMGPVFHGGNDHPSVNYSMVDDGSSYAYAAQDFIFGESLWGEARNWSAQPRVYYIVMGDPDSVDPRVNEWRTAMDWPIPSTKEAWYFHENGTLSNSTPSTPANLSYVYDPIDPVLNGGGTTFMINATRYTGTVDPLLRIGAYDNKLVEANRSDILKFRTPVLTAPVEIIGRIRATLNVMSNCTDTDFTAKLLDIYPDGREIIVADGILKTRYRDGFRSNETALMVPGNVYTLDVDLWSMAYRFTPGHQIQVSISSSNYPEFAANPNTGGAVTSWGLGDPVTIPYYHANNTVLLGQGATPSCIWFSRTE